MGGLPPLSPPPPLSRRDEVSMAVLAVMGAVEGGGDVGVIGWAGADVFTATLVGGGPPAEAAIAILLEGGASADAVGGGDDGCGCCPTADEAPPPLKALLKRGRCCAMPLLTVEANKSGEGSAGDGVEPNAEANDNGAGGP